MRERIECQAPGKAGCLVAKAVRHQSMRDFVDDHGHNKNDNIKHCVGCVHAISMIAYGNLYENMRDNKKELDHRRRIFQQNPCHQIQPDRQSSKTLKSSKEEDFY